MTTDKKGRKETPMARGLLDYFPDALAAVAHVSYVGNEQHNKGQEMHWAREKSTDHADCVIRHLAERGKVDDDGLLHSAKAAWRALALLQTEIENSSFKEGEDMPGTVQVIPAGATLGPVTEFGEPGSPGHKYVVTYTMPEASKYDGDWNWPTQTDGIWSIRGDKTYFTLNGRTRFAPKEDMYAREGAKSGALVRNTFNTEVNIDEFRKDS